ncbi:hypothetical protein UFOVP755_92 [uncultured Caudovirales phage]|uniref:BppU N-terminal domain-containing protein n=1 Tax=uncultured Caudovirales phage TaxID=2100421 RepID=A0A6J7X8I9_9CAUD|nr:hypothetical protein UFOVP755_92 [uncultured Caudovirales phage]
MAGLHNVEIIQGSTFTLEIQWKDASDTPISLDGMLINMQIRKSFEDNDTPLIDLSLGNGITYTGDIGGMIITIPANITRNLKQSTAKYDIEITNGDQVINLLRGNVNIIGEITR